MNRLQLQALLETYCKNVRYNPEPNIKLVYPCIIYSYKKPKDIPADDSAYILSDMYEILFISNSPTSDSGLRFSREVEGCRYINTYIVDGLRHEVVQITI